MPAEFFFDLTKSFDLIGREKRDFCLRVFKKICNRFDLAVRIHRHNDRAVVKCAEIRDCPRWVIFSDESHSIAEFNIFLAETVCDRAYSMKQLAECVDFVVAADYTHCYLVRALLKRRD